MSVSVPEKTLEHWASLHLTYRYRSKAALWWPVDGEDVDVQALPSRPGKTVKIELKTTIALATQHKVQVDIGQLWDYEHRPFAEQPYYAFPWPRWQGDLRAAARAGHVHETEIAFSRSGTAWWFAEWMVVLTTAQVAAVLRADLTAWGRRERGHKVTLARFHHPTRHQPRWRTTWGGGVTPGPDVRPWREFWSELEECGRPDWPQLVRVPAAATRGRVRFTRAEILAMLRAAADLTPRDLANEEWLTVGTDGENGFVAVSTYGSKQRTSPIKSNDLSHRVAVFLDASALFRTAEAPL